MMRLALHWQIMIALVLGAGIGIVANSVAGRHRFEERKEIRSSVEQLYGMSSPVRVPQARLWVEDRPHQILMEIDVPRPGDKPPQRRRVVVSAPTADLPEDWPDLPPQVDADDIRRVEAPTLDELKRIDPAAYVIFKMHGRSFARRLGDFAKALGDLFLRLLKMVSVPLIIVSLVSGVTGLGHAEKLGKMFGRTLLYYVSTSMLAIVTGLLMVNIIQPGNVGPDDATEATVPPAAASEEALVGEGKSLGTVLFEQVESMIPANPFEAVSEGNFLSIITFSIAFGVFTILVGGVVAERIRTAFEALFEVIMRMTMAIIHLAPLGVLFMMLSATAGQGVAIFGTLGMYMLTVTLALLVHALFTMPMILHFIARRNPLHYARALSPALLTAFSSASSNGTLPLTMTCVEENAGVSNRVTSFVLPLGATVNMDGTALYEVIAVLFIAQLTPGIELTLAQQVIVAFTALLASIGAAGIPHAGLVMMIIILQAVGLPTEKQALIIAVDRILDMGRTAVNVWSDSCGCAVVARFEAEHHGERATPRE